MFAMPRARVPQMINSAPAAAIPKVSNARPVAYIAGELQNILDIAKYVDDNTEKLINAINSDSGDDADLLAEYLVLFQGKVDVASGKNWEPAAAPAFHHLSNEKLIDIAKQVMPAVRIHRSKRCRYILIGKEKMLTPSGMAWLRAGLVALPEFVDAYWKLTPRPWASDYVKIVAEKRNIKLVELMWEIRVKLAADKKKAEEDEMKKLMEDESGEVGEDGDEDEVGEMDDAKDLD